MPALHMRRAFSHIFVGALLAVTIGCATPALAQTPANWGSAAFLTRRSCNGLAPSVNCLGRFNPNVRITESLYAGGPGVSTNASITPMGGGSAQSSITYGALDMPVIRAGSFSGADNRLNSNSIGYQSFTYTGAAATPFSLTALYDFTSSGASLALNAQIGNELGGEGYGFLRLQVFDAALFPTLLTARDIFDFGFNSQCGDAGVLSAASMSLSTAAAGPGNGSLSMGAACSGGALTLTPGAQFIVAMLLQTPSNRGGFFDATHTVTLGLSQDLPPDVRDSLNQSLVSGLSAAVPEPATWAMMILGFGIIGGALRRRSHPAAARMATPART
jgi:hypothetical protein